MPKNLNPHFPFDMVTAIFVIILGICFMYLIRKKNVRKNAVMIVLSLLILIVNYTLPLNRDKIFMTMCGNFEGGVVLSCNSHHIVVASPDEFYYSGNSSALRQNEVVDFWISPDSFVEELAEELTEIYSIKKIAVCKKFSDNDYKGSAELVIIGRDSEFDLGYMKITASGQYGLLNYFIMDDGEHKTYFSKYLNVLIHNVGILSNVNAICYGDATENLKTRLKHANIPESVNLYAFGESFGKY